MKLINKTKKITENLCDECKKKSTNEIIMNKEKGKKLNPNIWCDDCFPKIKTLHGVFNPVSKDIVEDYEK